MRTTRTLVVALMLVACGTGRSPVEALGRDAGNPFGGSQPAPDPTDPPNATTPESPRDAGVEAASDAAHVTPTGCMAPPMDPTKSAVCVSIEREAITFLDEPGFDGRGQVVVQAFPESERSPEIDPDGPILSPPFSPPRNLDADAGEAGADSIDLRNPIAPVRIDGLPAGVVHVRALFRDAPPSPGIERFGAGWWVGGYDTDRGVGYYGPSLVDVSVARGSTRNVTVRLVALRRVHIEISRESAVPPAGNGQGELSWAAFRKRDLNANGAAFGWGWHECGDLAGTAAVGTPGYVVGSGTFWLAASLADYGREGVDTIRGGMVMRAPGEHDILSDEYRLTVAPLAYSVEGVARLNKAYAAPDGGDAVSCR